MPEEVQKRRLFEQCVNRHADSMYRVAFRLTGTADLAGELVQETFLNAWRGLDSLQDPEKMRSWMFSILRNQYRKSMRAVSRARQIAAGSLDTLTDRAPGELSDESERVQQALNSLDDQHRFPLLLVTMEGLSVDAVAEMLDVPRGTVLSRLHRGREKLRRKLNLDSMEAGTEPSVPNKRHLS